MNKEEAIKVLNSRPYTGEVREALETLIPELKESEDEKVRKYLIEELKAAKSVGELKFAIPQPTREECITYLEKQKEQKPFWNPTEEDVVLFNKAITTNMTLTPQERAKLDIIRMKFKHCPYIEQKEQKTAEWSEEDEDMRDTIIRDLKRLGGDLVKVNPAYKEEINWLKLLPKRFILQPKAEWSKEDEKTFWGLTAYIPNEELERLGVTRNDILEKLKSLRPQSKIHYWTEEEIEPIISDYLTGREHYGGMMSRLRCLKPKSHWKLSVEQMNTLLSVEGILRSLRHDDKAKILASIYEQLKKLM